VLGNEGIFQTGGVVITGIVDDGNLGGAEVFFGELGHDLTLEGINVAGAEDVRALFGDIKGSGGRGDQWDVGLGSQLGDRDRRLGGDVTEDGDNLFLVDELVVGVDGFVDVAFFVQDGQFDLLAEDTAGFVDFVCGELEAIGGGNA